MRNYSEAMTTTTAPHRLWRNTPFLIWLVSDTSKGLAAGLFGFALPLVTLIVTGDAMQAGIIGAVAGVVRTLTTLYGGVLADRHSRTRLMVLGAAIGVVLSLAFTLLALGGSLTFTTLLVLTVLLAARAGFFDVAGESALKQIVPDSAMGRAQAANQARDAALQLAGGPLGGALLAVGAWLIGAAMTFCHLISAITAEMLRRGRRTASTDLAGDPGSEPGPEPGPVNEHLPSARPSTSAIAEMREGFGWLLGRADLRPVLFIATIINLGFNAGLTTVIFALQQSGHSPATIGWLSAGAGAAMLAGAAVAPLLVSRVRSGMLIMAGLTAATLGILVISQLHAPGAITAVLAASVLLLPALNAGLLGYFMVAVPTELLGRANSASMALSIGAMPLGPLIAGFGLTWIGSQQTILACAALCAIATVMAVGSRGVRSLPAEAGWSAHATRYAAPA